MTYRTLDGLLRARAAGMPGRLCLKASDGSSTLSYGELDRCASAFASALRRRGCRSGDRVILGLGNTPEFFACLFGCWRGGLIAVPVDAELAAEELRVLAAHAEPAAVVVGGGSETKFRELGLAAEIWAPGTGQASIAEALGVEEQVSAPAQDTETARPESLALLLYTSGTTGDAKGVALSHAALSRKIDSIAGWFGFDSSTTSLCLLPTHFGHGLICNCLSTFGYGGTLILAPPFNLDLLAELGSILASHGVNTFSSVPTVVRLLIRYARQRQVEIPACLRLVTCASAPLGVEEVEEFEGRFGVPLLNCYGLTETSGWSACSPNTEERNLASVGKAVGCEIRIVDSGGEPVEPGREGELQIRGPSVMVGYYKNPELTSAVLREGWFSTGDLGSMDATGAVFLASRIKELIIRAGKNIYPAEVDSVLMSHPEVAEACTVGLEDALLGERVAACVVRTEGSALSETALIAHAQERLIAYKCPQRILFVERIPKSSRGKVNRSGLRSLFESREVR